jgi:glycosyltransferase involved in cell wall biosynthesis
LKIAQICYSGLGGHSGVVFPLISADFENKHDWSIGFVGNTPMLKDFKDRCENLNIQYGQFEFNSGIPFVQWVNLFFWLKKIKPDSIICHNPTFVIPCKIYSLLFQRKLVVVEHTNNKLKRNREWLFTYLSLLLSNSVVVLTTSYKDELKKFFLGFVKESKISIVANGIAIELFPRVIDRSDRVIANKILKVGMAGRFSNTKRQDLLIEMLRIIKQSNPEFNIQLSLAGDGPELEKAKCTVENENLTPFITFEGLLNEVELAKWYGALDIYAHASSGETLSISLLQAMSCGLPIIASDVDGISNLLHQEEDYGLCIENDPLCFVDAVMNVSKNYQEAQSVGMKASIIVKKNYSNRGMLENYLSLL